jgi:hypothetical protein
MYGTQIPESCVNPLIGRNFGFKSDDWRRTGGKMRFSCPSGFPTPGGLPGGSIF